jgi:hypothetical protein
MKEQPQEAIFVKMVSPLCKTREIESKAKQIRVNINQKMAKLQLPSGPAWINGRWE